MLKTIKRLWAVWGRPDLRATAVKVAIVVGSLLFIINHGGAVLHGEMTASRWLAALLTYLVPYTVSIHGQLSAHSRSHRSLSSA